jgi:hypothetical protein
MVQRMRVECDWSDLRGRDMAPCLSSSPGKIQARGGCLFNSPRLHLGDISPITSLSA